MSGSSNRGSAVNGLGEGLYLVTFYLFINILSFYIAWAGLASVSLALG
jgi:hypothetical protein